MPTGWACKWGLESVVPTFQATRKLCVLIGLASLFTASAQAQDQIGRCLAQNSLFGDWEWHTENPSATSPKGSFTFSSELNSRGNNPLYTDVSGQGPGVQIDVCDLPRA